MPAANPPRWITVRKPFDYKWPGRTALTAFREADLGEHMVKAEVADYAVDNGFATEGKADGSEAKSRKSKPRKSRRKATKAAKSATPKGDAGPDIRSHQDVGGTDLAADDSASAGEPVAPAAE